MSAPCNNRWKQDDRFIKFRLPKDENGDIFVPICFHPKHTGVIKDPEYRFRHCEKKGKRKYCVHYHRFRDEKELQTYQTVRSIEVTINQDYN